ncbi:MAG: RNA methyltransferase [Bacteroidales bacterium]|nr:RNA methyltransferase [Bacteroidales bacterium]MCM1415033.1 RNA methyltransferase [bacterium]MCM1422887.1 RNA methyltransferase [bacterium]
MITSVHNKSIKETAALLAKKKERDRRGLFVVEGVKLFGEAPAERIEQVYVAESAKRQLTEQYGEKLKALPCETVSDEVFAKLSDTVTPQGILCLVRQYSYNIEEMLAAEKEKHLLFIILEDLQDPGNLGTIFRTAEAAGADGVIMSGGTADLYSPKTIRATMGSVYRVPFLYAESLLPVMETLRRHGVRVFAAHLSGKADYDAFDYRAGTAFLVGNEGRGLKEKTAAAADERIRLPMEGKVESLNAAVASSVLLYEAYRQRRNGL